MAHKDKFPKGRDKPITLADQLRARLGNQLDQLPDAVLSQLARVKAGGVLKNPHLETELSDDPLESRNMGELMMMFPPGTEGEKSSKARMSPTELQERPLIYKLDLHPEAKRPDEKLDEIVEKKSGILLFQEYVPETRHLNMS